MNDNENQNDPYAANTAIFEAHMEAARRLAVKDAEDAAARPTPEPRPEQKRGLL